jgi:hypothetical protein
MNGVCRSSVSFAVAAPAAVDDENYQVPFRFSGTIDKLTVKLGPNGIRRRR